MIRNKFDTMGRLRAVMVKKLNKNNKLTNTLLVLLGIKCQISLSRGIISAKLQGRKRVSSCSAKM